MSSRMLGGREPLCDVIRHFINFAPPSVATYDGVLGEVGARDIFADFEDLALSVPSSGLTAYWAYTGKFRAPSLWSQPDRGRSAGV